MRDKHPYKIIALIILLCFATRIPQLISPNILLDGDESVVAIMAKHIYVGRDFPLFFYGQQYGFSLIECLFIIPFYCFLGISALAVKLGMLSLWTVGVVFLYKTLAAINDKPRRLAFILTLVFICTPAWAVWSMKARGGYLTAFALTSIILYLLFRSKPINIISSIIIGILLVIIYESQLLWLPGMAPLICFKLFERKNIKHVIPMVIVSAPLFYWFHRYRMSLFSFYAPQSFTPDSIQYVKRIPDFIYESIQGNYYFSFLQKPNLFCAVCGYLFTAIVFFLLLAALYNVIRRKKGTAFFNCSTLSLLFTLAYTPFSHDIEPRYLLPLTGYTLISLMLYLKDKQLSFKQLAYPAYLFVSFGFISLITFWGFSFCQPTEKDFKATVKYLKDNNIDFVFFIDGPRTWQMIFYSNETLFCREPYMPGRYPAYTVVMNKAYMEHKRTALVSYWGELTGMDQARITDFHHFSIIVNPSRDMLPSQYQFK